MRKHLTAIVAAALLLGILCGCGGSPEESVTVQKVSRVSAQGSVGLVNRYAGVVVSGETAEVQKEDKKVKEVLVKEGDWVAEGDVLFSYDMEAMELDLSKLLLELDGLENTILNAQDEIPQLEKQRDAAPAAQQLSYSLQIQSLQADIREATYNKGLKEREIANLQESLEDTDVRSPIAGRIMSVKETDDNGGMDWNGNSDSNAFITVMDMTTYQVKGNINEMNVGTLMEGMRVIIRSRLDESTTWNGVLDRIDWENKVSDENNGYYYGPSDEMTTSSKYPFFVTLDNVTGLILGQHVYIEPDYGQNADRDGLWLPEYYISDANAGAWVWVANRHDRLEKRPVTLGEYSGETGEYRILSGLSEDDYIAFPEEGLQAGQPTSVYDPARAGTEYASGGNAFFGGFYASGGDASEVEWDAPDESLYAEEDADAPSDFVAVEPAEREG